MPIEQLELTASERAAADAILWDVGKLHGEPVRQNGERAAEIMNSLLQRGALVGARECYLFDPTYNPGGHGRSRIEIFEKNGCHGDAIYRHPHFLPHLRYLLHGASLPANTIAAFLAEVEDCGDVTSGDVAPLCQTARQLARTTGLTGQRGADEFFKLALDCGLDGDVARSVRDAVMSVKP